MFGNFEKREIRMRSLEYRRRLRKRRSKISSSVIKDIEFDNSKYNLKINFSSGNSYVYGPVTKDFYEKFLNSKSKGLFYNTHIRNNEALSCLKVIR